MNNPLLNDLNLNGPSKSESPPRGLQPLSEHQNGIPGAPHRSLPSRSKPILWIGGALVLTGAIVGTTLLLMGSSTVNRADLLYHTVKLENLDLTVVERGTLESAENRDVICRVKATKGGTYATTIKWVIDDGTLVRAGQPIVTLDSSALEDQFLAQKIVVEQARAKKISTEENYKIVESQNESFEATAKITIELAELKLEKYAGLPKGTLGAMPQAEAKALLLEMEKDLDPFLQKHRARLGVGKGEYQGLIDDLVGRIELARADVESWRDRVSYSQRMEQKGYVSPSQVQSDESRLASAFEAFKKVETERNLLRTFTSHESVKDLSSKVQEAWRAFDRVKKESRAKEIQAAADRDTALSVFNQEEDKLDEIEKQIHECKIVAPQDGMVVYYVSEQSRFGSGSQQSIIAQGEPVREGQKLMRIPDLRRMQVSTRVHEAMVSRVRGDDRRSTGFADSLRASMLVNRDALSRWFAQQDMVQESIREAYRDKEYYLASAGQKALVRVDAFSERSLQSHVKSVATVASQQDWSSSDVKVYQTIVAIDESRAGLKPGMSAEVTILVDNAGDNVLTVPIQSIIGGAESGRTRKIYVKSGAGPVEREIVVGLSNEKMAEVKEGLQPGDQVIINPKVLLGDKIKTREPGDSKDALRSKWGEGKGSFGTKGGGAKGGMKGGPPAKLPEGGAPQ